MRPIVITTTALTNDPNGIAEDQTTSGAADLVLDGALVVNGVAILPEAQIVGIEGAGDNTGIDFTVTGTDADGKTISETIDGLSNDTAVTTAHFKTITLVSADGAVTGNVEIGCASANGGVTKSIPTNWVQNPYTQSLFIDVTGTINATVQHTENDPQGVYASSFSTNATWRATTGLTTVTADAESNIAFPVRAVRVGINSGTGTLVFTTIQGA